MSWKGYAFALLAEHEGGRGRGTGNVEKVPWCVVGCAWRVRVMPEVVATPRVE